MSKAVEAFKDELYGRGYDTSSFKVSRMVGTTLPTAGLSIPEIKKVVVSHFADVTLPLEDFDKEESVELTLCYFWLSLKRLPTFADQMAFLEKKLRYANTWEITDSLSQYMRKGSYSDFLPYFKRFSHSRFVYERRFAYVYAMRYYKEKDISVLLKGILPEDEYYIYMGQAWLLATLAIGHFDEVVSALRTKKWPLALRRKTISKMVDSFRITDEQKAVIKKVREGFAKN